MRPRILGKLLIEGPLTRFEAVPAMEMLKVFDEKNWRATVEDAVVNGSIDADGKANILERLLKQRGDAERVAKLARKALSSSDAEGRSSLENVYTLALISSEGFRTAKKFLVSTGGKMETSRSPSKVFNYAMAEWGDLGIPPADLLNRVLTLNSELELI